MGKLEVNPNSRNRTRHTATVGPLLPAAILALGPGAYYKLNEINSGSIVSGSTSAVDFSGNGRAGTYTELAGTFSFQTGPDGVKYADFGNGGGTYVNMADANFWSMDTTPGISLFLLCKPDSVAGTTPQYLWSKGTGSAFEWGWAMNDNAAGRVTSRLWTSAGNAIMAAHADIGTTGWQALVIVPNVGAAINQNDAILIYRNNNTDQHVADATSASTYTNSTAVPLIGWRGDTPSGQYWQGAIAHAAAFSGELSTTQIQTLMDAAHADGWF